MRIVIILCLALLVACQKRSPETPVSHALAGYQEFYVLLVSLSKEQREASVEQLQKIGKVEAINDIINATAPFPFLIISSHHDRTDVRVMAEVEILQNGCKAAASIWSESDFHSNQAAYPEITADGQVIFKESSTSVSEPVLSRFTRDYKLANADGAPKFHVFLFPPS